MTLLSASAYAKSSNAANLGNGKAIFQDNCIVCHGPLGHGDGIAAGNLKNRPANISKKLNSFFESDSELTNDVLRGKTGMPAFKGRLSKADIRDIFAYIRSVNK